MRVAQANEVVFMNKKIGNGETIAVYIIKYI